jgi:thymidylate kinase
MKRGSEKSKGKIIIFEGVWGVDKTTLCLYLKKHYNFLFIPEPNHIKAGLKTKDRKIITNWYLQEHFRNLKKAFKLAKEKKNVVVERSPISSLAFAEAFFNESLFSNDISKKMENLSKKYKIRPYFVLLEHPDLHSLSRHLSKDRQMVIYSNLNFLKKFQKYLLLFSNLFERKGYFNVIRLKSGKNIVKKFVKIISKTP